MAVETTRMTAEELLRLPEDGLIHELIEGELRRMSPAGFEHGHIAMVAGSSLAQFVRQHRLGRVTAAETGFLLRRNPDTVRAPDVGFVRQDRLVESTGYFPGAPDLAIEVISPRDTWSEVDAKVSDWLGSGVRMVILIDPAKQRASIHRPGGEILRLAIEGTIDGGEVVPGWTLALRDLFAD